MNFFIRLVIPGLWLAPVMSLFAAPLLERTNLFASGTEGYKMFRIPGVVVTARGSIVVCCEARRGGSDWGDNDILLRRSNDAGMNWSGTIRIPAVADPKPKNPIRAKANPAETTYNNPLLLAETNGMVHLLFCVEYMRCFHCWSDDDGLTWSKPEEITPIFAAFRPDYNWKVIATGPGHGIQLYNGRLLVPVWLSLGQGANNHSPSIAAVIFSDDHGRHWQRGGIAITHTEATPSASESELVQLSDGSVLMNARSAVKQRQRVVTTSPDGGVTWRSPELQPALPSPVCMASIIRLPAAGKGGKDRLLFSQPLPENWPATDRADPKALDRKDLTVRVSSDDGRSWPVQARLEAGPAAYSDLAILPDRTVVCFYESARNPQGNSPYGFLTLARFNLAWLTQGRDGD